MTRHLPCLALPLFLAAPAAHALTPDELWAAWQARVAGLGATLSAEVEQRPDGALVLRDPALALDGGAPETMPPGPLSEVTLTPAEGGAVAIGLAVGPRADIPLGGPADGALRWEQEGLAITARDGETGAGGAGGIDYELTAERLRLVTLTSSDAVAAPMDFAMELAGVSLRVPDRPAAGGPTILALTLAADGLAYILNTEDPFAGATTGTSRSEDLLVDLGLTLPAGATVESLGAEDGVGFLRALEDGLALRLDFSAGPSAQTGSATGAMMAYDYNSTAGASRLALTLDGTGAGFSGGGDGLSVSGSSPFLPFGPLDLTMGPYEADFRVPLGPAPGEFRYRVSLEDVVLSDAAWAAFDPEGRLPREPARFVVDLGGRATIDATALAAEAAAGAPPTPPSIESLDVRALDLAAAGARLTGTGSFTFDNASGMPVPLGTADLRLEGLDRLLDALVEIGLVTAQDAGNARLGLATFFRAGDGPDVRETTIEARPGGQVFVNGQQVQ